ncbi:MAG: glucose-1-phosphate adenylyltransferase [Clostridia bacterium]|jgi:glucose-1-phosphate adenylyltransferase|nr:glucose-1-phosphate adenylyltransferase [Clostridia bacterium]
MRKKKCVAMLLAGGQGSRLGILTKKVAKPAVPFGGKFRIIDFPLSNCTNSSIDVVGVLTQYRPLELNSYIGSGSPWDLDLSNGGVFVLPPYQTGKTGEWYKGTANAIYQNIPFIEQWDPDYVLVLSGDHIYKMDYNAMLRAHIDKGADLTIAVREVPWEDASRFGILNTDENDRIIEFEEKPAKPKSNKASMGVYIFTWSKMRKYLELDEADPKSDNDFGKNIIPEMLNANEKLFTYTFEGYWKDVGTIESLWESNMDLLTLPMPIDLSDKRWRIYARNPGMPPHYIDKGAKVYNSLITEGCEVKGIVRHSVLFAGVTVDVGAEVTDAVVMPGAIIERGAVVRRAIVAENAVIKAGAIVGEETGNIAVVGPGATIASGETVAAGVQIDADAQ